MAIIYDLNNALKPPILNNITELNAPVGGALAISGQNELQINSNDVISINGQSITIGGTFVSISSTNNIVLTGSGLLVVQSLTTLEILALTPVVGMFCFNVNIQQMVFYQFSPITGINIGWYNSTGTIQL
jgi:hypothetical protein